MERVSILLEKYGCLFNFITLNGNYYLQDMTRFFLSFLDYIMICEGFIQFC